MTGDLIMDIAIFVEAHDLFSAVLFGMLLMFFYSAVRAGMEVDALKREAQCHE